MSQLKTLDHPTFGPCELVHHLIAIRWKIRLPIHVIISKLKSYSLMLASEVPEVGEPAREGVRDPRLVHVNQSETLTWAMAKKFTEEMLNRLKEDDDVLWVAPVFRAVQAERGPQSFFAINPTVLLVTKQAAARLGDLSALGESVSIDEARTQLLRGFVVLIFPRHNAIEVGERLMRELGAGSILFENFPYLSPTASREGEEHGTHGKHGGCGEHCGYCGRCGHHGHGKHGRHGKHGCDEHCGYCGRCGCDEHCGHCRHDGCDGHGTHGTHGKHGEGQRGRCGAAGRELIPNDPLFPTQWDMLQINAPRAWPISEGSPDVVIAVLDQGVELGHPDLDMLPLSYSTISHTNDGSPVGSHGTACAGIIGGRINNAIGVAGLAGRSRVMAIATDFSDVEVAEGLYWAADNGARVVSMSFGVYPSWMVWNFAIIQAALQFCQARNLVLVAATGNENQSVSRFPATDPTTIGVGGSNRADVRKAVGDASLEPWWGACFGPDVDVVAPCLEIPTTDRLGALGYTPTDYDLQFNGTSSATPHVSALAGLIFSVNPSLTNVQVRRILSETADKINQPAYVYAPTAGKPFGTWNDQVGYGRINAERALLVACATTERCELTRECSVDLQPPDKCCVSPCDPPWCPCEACAVCCETRCLCVPIKRDCECPETTILAGKGTIEICVAFEHTLCLGGKQQGPLLFTQTLLPGEKVTLFHHERYRRVTGEADRFSVQTTFLQFLSAVHQAKAAGSLELLCDRLTTARGNTSVAVGGGLAGLLGGIGSSEVRVTDPHQLRVSAVAEAFQRSAMQSAQMTHAERSLVITTQEDKETGSASARTLQNHNECRAVTYFVRQVMELLCLTTRVCEIKLRVLAPGISPEWRSIEDLGSLPRSIQEEIEHVVKHLPKCGETREHPGRIALPTDGAVYDPELAHCSSCEPERAAALAIQLEKQKAEALQACLEAQALELELERRRRLLESGDLSPFGG